MSMPAIFDRLLGRRYLSVLMYHGIIAEPLPVPDWCFIDAAEFRAQMEALVHSGVEVLPLEGAVRRLRAGTLDGPAVSLTFDDGYRNNLTVALSILKDFGLPATIFLTTGLVGTARGLWPSRVAHAVATTRQPSVSFDDATFDLSTPADRASASAALQALIKARHGDAPEDAATRLEAALCVPHDPPLDRHPAFAMLSPAEIRDALASGLVEFGAHTVSHPLLSRLSDDRLADEIGRSIADTARLTGRPCRLFAYPNGRLEDFDDRAVAHLRAAGIEAAVTTVEGANTADTDPFRLKRWHVGRGLRPVVYKAKLHNLIPAGL